MTARLVLVVVVVVAAVSAGIALEAQRPAPILMGGPVHLTNRVYWEGIDPWKPQPVGDWDFARARQSGVNVVFENIAPYGYHTYNTTVKHAGRLIETFHRMMEANSDKMEI